MASPINIIKSCTRDISSGSKSKRNEALSRLKNLLTEGFPLDDAEAKALGKTIETTVWTQLIVCLHMALTSEVDPYLRPNDKNAAVMKCEELLSIIVRRISYGHATVTVKDLIPCILEVIRSRHYRALLAGTYLHLALTLLNMKKYLFAVGFTLLKDMADRCMQLLKDRSAPLFEDQLLMVLITVSRHSCNDTQLEFYLRTKFSFLLELFENREMDGSLKQKMLIELAVIFCLQMILHHPCGVRMEGYGFYAKDLNTWKEIIPLLYECVCDSIEEMSNVKPHDLEQFFVKFAASVCNQMFDTESEQVRLEEEIAIPAKRRRKQHTGISFYDVAKKMGEKWPWIQVLSKVLSFSQDALKKEEYLPVLKLLLELQNTSKEAIIMQHICGFLSYLLKMEFLPHIDDKTEINETWTAISATTIRMVGLNQHQTATHSLLQQLLIHRKVPKPGDLMVMFLQGIKFSEASLKTWITLFSEFNLFDKCDPQGRCNKAYFVCLMQWLSPPLKNTKMPTVAPKTISNAFLSLVCNEGVVQHIDIENIEQAHSGTYLEEVLMWSSLEVGSVIKVRNDSTETLSLRKHFTKDCDPSNRTLLVEILEKYASASVELLCDTSDNRLEIFKIFIHRLLILSTTLSDMVECHVLNDDDDDSFERLKTSLSNMTKAAAEFAKEYLDKHLATTSQDNALEFYRTLNDVFSTRFVPSVLHIIQQECFFSLSADILEFSTAKLLHSNVGAAEFDIEAGMTEEVKSQDEEEHCVDLYQDLSFDEISIETCLGRLTVGRKLQLFYEALMTVASFASNCAEGKMLTDEQSKIITKIMTLLDRPNFQEFLGIGMNLVKNLIKCTSLTITHVNEIFILMKRACNEEFYSDANVAALLHLLLIEMLKYTSVKEVQVKMMMFLKLINNRIISKKSVGGKAIIQFQKLLIRIIKVDPHSIWAVCDAPPYKQSEETNKYPFYTHILKYLNHNNQDVRMEATKCLSIIFKPIMMDIKAYKWLFQTFSEQLENCFHIEDVPVGFQSVDESANRTAVVLQNWTTIVVVSSFLRKKGMFNILKVERTHSVNIELMKRGMLLVAKQLDLQSVEDMFVIMQQQLRYMITWWLHFQYDINDFRWVLFGYNSGEEFFTEQAKIILPLMIQNSGISDANLAVFDRTSEEQMINNAQYVLAACLPLLSANNSEYCLLMSQEKAQHAYQYLTQILTDETVAKLFSQKSHEMFAEVLHLLHDPTHFLSLCGHCSVILPEPELPCCDIKTVENVLQFIQVKAPYKYQELICHWAINELPCIEKLLIMLEARVQKMVLIEDKLKYLYQYCTYVNLVALCLQTHSTEVPSNVAQYIIEMVTYRLMNLIDTQSEEKVPVAAAALHYYEVFCRRLLPRFQEVVGKLLNFLVSRVASLAAANSDVSTSAVRLLQLLIVENEACLKKYIRTLDPLPKHEVLYEVSAVQEKYSTEECTLQETIENFLLKKDQQRAEALKNLRIQLVRRKFELSQMYTLLHTKRGFSEDCATSAIHRLIYVLVQLSHYPRLEVCVEATKCLGELGPASLGTIVLQPESILITYKNCSAYDTDYRFVSYVLNSLCGYLMESEVSALETASDILYTFVNTIVGKNIMSSEQYRKENENRYLMLPYVDKTTSPLPMKFNSGLFQTVACDMEVWSPQIPTSHEQWITTLSSKLLTCFVSSDSSVTLLIKMCVMKASFAENILPYILSLIRGQCEDIIWGRVIKFFRKFFEEFFKSIVSEEDNGLKVQNLTDDSKMIHSNKVSLKCMLNAVQYLWINGIETSETEQLNFITVAQAALSCASFFTALQCAERWCIQELREANCRKLVAKLDISQSLMTMKDRNKLYGNVVEKILKQANANIGEVDAWHGCGKSHLETPEGRRYHYEMKGEWDNVLLSCEPQLLPFHKDYMQNTYMRPLQRLGMFDLLYISSTRAEDESEKHSYECMWRLGDWSQLGYCSKRGGDAFGMYQSDTEETNIFEEIHYNALKAVRDSNFDLAKNFLQKAREHMGTIFKHINTECCQNLYESLSKLQLLNQIEDFIYSYKAQDIFNLSEKWSTKDSCRSMEMKYYEPMISQRIALIKISLEKENNSVLQKKLCRLLGEMHLEIGKKAHQELCFSLAERQLNALHSASNIPQDVMLNVLLEEAVLYWDKGQKDVGQHLLKKLISLVDKPLASIYELGRNCEELIHATARKHFGDWMVETGSGNTQVIIKDYYQRSLELMEKTSSPAEKAAAYLALARFADAQYQERVNYITSAEFKVKHSLIEKAKALLRETKEENRVAQMNRSMVASHSKELQDMEEERYVYLELALKSYLESLKLDDVRELQVFRFVSLWLENKFEERLSPLIETYVLKIPMHKFLPVLPQLVPHLNESMTSWFSGAVMKILESVARQHPYHVLPLIISVLNLQKDKHFVAGGSKSEHLKPRVEGAQNILGRLQDTGRLQTIVNDMQEVFSVLIRVAYIAGNNPGRYPIPERLMKELTDKVKVPVLTDNIPVRANSDYNNIVGIHRYEKTYEICGGIHAPKKLICIGTDGVKRIQLIKGNDDLRQDAVMMQVFSIMNRLLRENPETRKRKLHIRTYKIVPCSHLSGVIEWCSNTIPLGQYLLKKHGVDFKSASREMSRVAAKPLEERLTVYQNICKTLDPVLHKFFLETFKIPCIWYERRLSYIRSVAVASMTGYILGIGDRHTFNILLDQESGELIHIDFGIAYEQGKFLKIPEIVPFRLTRELEDGMGVSGIEGVYRRCCEKTIEVLRANKDTIYAIVEVLLYDPLYTWVLSSSKAQKAQSGEEQLAGIEYSTSSDINIMAKMVLLKLKNKLQGTEEGTQQSVSGQVNKLIEAARDPQNLCRMFKGWQPYL